MPFNPKLDFSAINIVPSKVSVYKSYTNNSNENDVKRIKALEKTNKKLLERIDHLEISDQNLRRMNSMLVNSIRCLRMNINTKFSTKFDSSLTDVSMDTIYQDGARDKTPFICSLPKTKSYNEQSKNSLNLYEVKSVNDTEEGNGDETFGNRLHVNNQ